MKEKLKEIFVLATVIFAAVGIGAVVYAIVELTALR